MAEAEERALRREVTEETGMEIQSAVLRTRYQNKADIPCLTSVFEAEVNGQLKDSWEGSPAWIPSANSGRNSSRASCPFWGSSWRRSAALSNDRTPKHAAQSPDSITRDPSTCTGC